MLSIPLQNFAPVTHPLHFGSVVEACDFNANANALAFDTFALMRAVLSLSMVWPKDLESMRSVSGVMDEVVQLVKGAGVSTG